MSDLELGALIGDVSLMGVDFFEIRASRLAVDRSAEAIEGQLLGQNSLQTGWKDDGTAFRVRIRSQIAAAEGLVVVDAAVEYGVHTLTKDDVSGELLMTFANDVGLMQLMPYVRQAVADISQRIFGTPILMPVFQRGDLTFRLEDSVESSEIPST